MKRGTSPPIPRRPAPPPPAQSANLGTIVVVTPEGHAFLHQAGAIIPPPPPPRPTRPVPPPTAPPCLRSLLHNVQWLWPQLFQVIGLAEYRRLDSFERLDRETARLLVGNLTGVTAHALGSLSSQALIADHHWLCAYGTTISSTLRDRQWCIDLRIQNNHLVHPER